MDISELLKELEEEENKKSAKGPVNFKYILKKYTKHWHWFLISVLVCGISAYAIAYFSTPQYLISSSLVIKDQKKGSDFTSNMLLDGSAASRNMYVVENEAEVFKSESLMIKACQELNFNHAFWKPNGPFRWKEIYDWEVPVVLTVHERRTDFFEEIDDNTVKIKILNDSSFELETPEGEKKIAKFGEKLQNFYGTFSIEKNETYATFLDNHLNPIKIAFYDPIAVGKYFAYNLSADVVNKQASVIELFLHAEHPERGVKVLNKLIELYNRETEDEKNQIARNTIAFIDEQLQELGSELKAIEKEAEQYKLNYSITDVGAESELYLESTTANRQQISALSVQIDVLESIEDYITRDENNFQMVPSTLNIDDQTLSELIANFNTLQRQREGMLRTTQPNNPIVQNLNQQLTSLKISILENIKNIKNGLMISRNSLMATASQFQSRASKVPTIERELLDINRNQSIKQDHYLLLTQKREEAMLTLAATSSNSKVIDPPSAYDKPVKPKKTLIYIFGIFLGLGIPFGFIYVKDLMDDTIRLKSDVQHLTSTQILGEISNNKENLGILALRPGKKTLIAEQFRFIRSNLAPIIFKTKGKVIMVSSGMSGEGKTFFSLNLAVSFALTGKKVALLEMDLRKPALLSALKIKAKRGISDLLRENKSDVHSIIHKLHNNENVDLIGCGSIPENPSELLANPTLFEIIEKLKESHDYLIIDTAPVGLVSDSFMLSEISDLTIFMVRCNYTTKAQIHTIEDIRKNKRFKNPMIVLNDAEMEITYGYGPKYAAGYYKA
ncbi:GumC family protein [Shivajiella indica]|uniref:non-specific protein-tyrosine kinase n=1 Tax=Shivajiella indica TaxID=872115 RepID=A0ABW5BCY4_9BACT